MMSEILQSLILVTGATGFVGGHLTRRLVAEGCSVRLLVRELSRLPAEFAQACDVVLGGLDDAVALSRAVRGVGVVFHCAANVHTWDTREGYDEANVHGVRNLLKAIDRESPDLLRFVHLSTVDVYGFPNTPCDERCVTGGGGFGYGESKLQGELLVREYCGSASIPYVILRPTNVIGPGSQFIKHIGKALQSGVMLKVAGGQANAGLLFVDNLVDYLLWAARAERAVGTCYNVRDAYDISWAEFLVAFRRAIHGRGLMVNLPFAMADWIAWGMEALYHQRSPAHEPLLHCLLVRIFGRTCGHFANQIRADSGYTGAVDFGEALNRSASWFLSTQSSQ